MGYSRFRGSKLRYFLHPLLIRVIKCYPSSSSICSRIPIRKLLLRISL
nr:MAG TPA: hypothetical protein [Caudoviricetes sp.]DAV60199.1 MAG TPA: hypothetical protein [Caudoviricetes sp.]